MTEAISEFLANLFNDNVVLATIFISMIPLFELKVGIPFGMSTDFWKQPLSNWAALFSGVAGGLIVTFILAAIFKPIYNAIKDKKFFKSLVEFFTGSAANKTSEVEQKTTNVSSKKRLFIKMLTAFVFVAIPVPGTGVYTGTVLAVFLGLNYWQTCLSVTLGNILAGIIIMFICSLFPDFTTIIMVVFAAIILAYLGYRVVVHYVKKNSNKKADLPEEQNLNDLNNK